MSTHLTFLLFCVSLVALGANGADSLVIISPPDLCAAWADYAAQRRSAGVEVEVANAAAIYAAHPFGASFECRNAAESIHAFVREKSASGANAFLLGGTWIDVAATNDVFLATGERLSLSNAIPGVCVRPHGASGMECAPSDLFYACLGACSLGARWDENGDGEYLGPGEWSMCDLRADVAVGRFPAMPASYGGGTMPASAIVAGYAAKIVRACGPGFSGSGRICAASSTLAFDYAKDDPSFGDSFAEMRFFVDVPNIWSLFHAPRVADTEFVVRETLRTCVMPFWPVDEVVSVHASGPSIASRHANLAAARDDFFAQDSVFSICRSHGGANVAVNASGILWITRDRYAAATGLSLFAEYSGPCRTGQMDCTVQSDGRLYAEPSLGVAAVCSPHGGVATGVFNSRDGISTWTAPLAVCDGLSSAVGYFTAKHIFEGRARSFGEAFLHARQNYSDAYARSADAVYALAEQLFLGDPTIAVPTVRHNAVLSGAECADGARVTCERALLAPTAHGVISGGGTLRVMENLEVEDADCRIEVAGGVGKSVLFTGNVPGRLTLAAVDEFYLGGASNCVEILVTGSGKIVDATWGCQGLAALALETDGTNTLRCAKPGMLSEIEALTSRGGALVLETAEAFGAGVVPFARVEEGELVVAPSPRVGRNDGGERLARPIALSGASMVVREGAQLSFGRRDGGILKPFTLQVEGEACLRGEDGEATPSVQLVGMTTVTLEEDAELAIELEMVDADEGALVFAGSGAAVARTARSLAGSVEVACGTSLALCEVPLVNATSLVVRAGATLCMPAEASGRHHLLPNGGRLIVEDGAEVLDLAGKRITGKACGAVFFEESSALRWKGGNGAWSDADAWFDYVTGEFGAWKEGLAAVFDCPDGSEVTNDLSEVRVAALVFAADASIRGGRVACGSGWLDVPQGTVATFAAELGIAGDVTKSGLGRLELKGRFDVSEGAVLVREGVLRLDEVDAPGVTNLAVQSDAFLELCGRSSFTNAAARSTIATNALRRVDGVAEARLSLGVFTPKKSFCVPEGVALEVCAPPLDDGGRVWTATVDGLIDYNGVINGTYGKLGGGGTVRAVGVRSRSSSGMGYGECRLEMRPGEGSVFPVLGFIDWAYAFVVFDGTVVAPFGGDVTMGGDPLERSRVAMYVDKNGLVFDTLDRSCAAPVARTVLIGGMDGEEGLFFGGTGDVTKVGEGMVRFTSVEDQHVGRTVVRGGAMSFAVGSATSGFEVCGGAALLLEGPFYEAPVELGEGALLDLSCEAPTLVACTNFVMASGSEMRMTAGRDGCDFVDVRGGTLSLPDGGTVRFEVRMTRDSQCGFHPVLLADALPGDLLRRVTVNVDAPEGRVTRVETDAGMLGVRTWSLGTLFLLR
ncbi:MAG: hypothetical protein IJ146_06155 [Kiritimatiellae bacterium]|nr:hypothetical protein [Kiritimatiellia bacterium]